VRCCVQAKAELARLPAADQVASRLSANSMRAANDAVSVTGLVIALAISATVVDSSPFSTAGALVVANTAAAERAVVYRGLLAWAAVMVVTAPLATWLLFVVLA